MEQKRRRTVTRRHRGHGEDFKGRNFIELSLICEFANSVSRGGAFALSRFSGFPISLAHCRAHASIVAQALNQLKRTIDRTRRFLKIPVEFGHSCANSAIVEQPCRSGSAARSRRYGSGHRRAGFAIVAHPSLRKFLGT